MGTAGLRREGAAGRRRGGTLGGEAEVQLGGEGGVGAAGWRRGGTGPLALALKEYHITNGPNGLNAYRLQIHTILRPFSSVSPFRLDKFLPEFTQANPCPVLYQSLL